MAERKKVLITFKPKDQRSEQSKDKREIVQDDVKARLEFVDVGALQRRDQLPTAVPPDRLALDINEYAAPIVAATLTDDEINALKANQNVAAVEEDGLCYAMPTRLEEALHYEEQSAQETETVPWGISRVKAPRAWECSRGKAVKVAVLDTGIDGDHPDLAANYRGGVSLVTDESQSMDYNGHGTHCAGTIAAALNGAGVVGVAPAAYLYAVKVLSRSGSGNWSYLIAGLEWCINNDIHIANMSLGGSSAPMALRAMCDLAWQRGVLLVGAAGNSAGPVESPARFDSVIAVSAIDSANTLASFSCRGPEVELCAPGVNVLSTLPEGQYGTLSGTSMACPHVAGAAAVALGAHRYTDNVTLRRLLAWTADNLGVPGRDDQFGFGRIDAERAACEFVVPPQIDGIP
ncbi:hypothetical protein CAI21_17385 [Alkalilimnicola ehrlichii]|uniref:Peptidase S8/S53 domain-containing protein n=1 Tax=Alkalilimnicola ehrlichii TaxID=351052 RepID=A0A3E0WME3_9GAMM|nr:S8 family peptidase [Alkalilimnicola ehrlichii]RFA26252.1 hypothetical protein CAI21_17385 [Alkalilimnicola ehrlichii]RFA33237.1 hypothetical protein CAL65_17870 [Alkalilimnicola ehrlichii]